MHVGKKQVPNKNQIQDWGYTMELLESFPHYVSSDEKSLSSFSNKYPEKQHVPDMSSILGTENVMESKSVTAMIEFIAHQGRWTIKPTITTDSLKDHNNVMAVDLVKPLSTALGLNKADLPSQGQQESEKQSSTTKTHSSKKINL